MTQAQLEIAVADATGESLHTIHRLGFSILGAAPDGPGPEDLTLVLDCPFCRRPVPYPGRCRDGSNPLGECLDCDVYFGFGDDEVYATGARAASGA
jgi:hypothetical protein